MATMPDRVSLVAKRITPRHRLFLALLVAGSAVSYAAQPFAAIGVAAIIGLAWSVRR